MKKEWETHIQKIRIYNQNIAILFGIEKNLISKMKNGKRKTQTEE